MPSKVIVDAQIVDNTWTKVDATNDLKSDQPSGDLILPLTLWNRKNELFTNHEGKIGLWLASNELPEMIDGDINSIPVIAIDFSPFGDGRGFSIGRLLRERFAFSGELRAIGAPLRDQMTYLKRCGFNAFELAEHYDPSEALASLKDFSVGYQTSVDQPEPLFKH